MLNNEKSKVVFTREYYNIAHRFCDQKSLEIKFEELQNHIKTVMSDSSSIRFLMKESADIAYDMIHAVDALAEHQTGYLELVSDELDIIADLISIDADKLGCRNFITRG